MCLAPSFVWVSKGPSFQKVAVSCKRCWRCIENRKNDYVGRALAEAAYSDWVVTVTLTYRPRDDLADKLLHPPHFQRFVRSLRARDRYKFRYFVAGEYGELKGRPHFHAILFGRGEKPDWPQGERHWVGQWPHGHILADWRSDHRALSYVMKYLNKENSKQCWFSVSKKPPLGAAFFADKAAMHVATGVLPRSFIYQPPGGKKSGGYMMTGATRRDFILAVMDGYRERYPLNLERLSEWVLSTFLSEERRRAEHLGEWGPLVEYVECLKEQLDRGRPSAAIFRGIEMSLAQDYAWQPEVGYGQ